MSRRTLAGPVTALALVAAPLAAPSPAAATLVDPYVSAWVNVSEGTGDAGACVAQPVSDDTRVTSAFPENGQWSGVTDTYAGTVVDPADAADRTALSATGTARLRATAVNDSFRSWDVEASVSASRSADQGLDSNCSSWIAADTQSIVGIVTREAGWFTITVDARQPDGDFGSVTLSSNRTGGEGAAVIYSNSGPVTARLYRPAGAYFLGHDLDLVAANNGAVSGTLAGSVRFTPAGSAEGRATGPARRLLKLPDSLSCAKGRADLRLTKKAKALRGVRSAVVTATGAKKVKVTRLKPGRKVAVKGVDLGRPVTVEATLTTRQGRTLSVERNYVSCR